MGLDFPYRRTGRVIGVAALLCLLSTSSSQAITWTAGGDKTNWFDAANWGGTLPQNGDDVLINTGGPVLLSNSTPVLASFTITNATLTLTNWSTALIATNITILTNGKITHASCDTNTVLSNTNRVFIQCSNLTVAAGGSVNANSLGFRGGPAANSYGQGPSRPYDGGGAGYGGAGGRGYYANYPGVTYGSADNPTEPGSGGGGHNLNAGSPGGGAIRIEADGTVTLEGTVTALGGSAADQGGRGSGGGVHIVCRDFTGTNGSIRADGGNGTITPGGGGGGGGGRIAVFYANNDTFYGPRSVAGGIGGAPAYTGSCGTVHHECTAADPVLFIAGSPADYGAASPYPYGYTAVPPGTSVTDSVPFRVDATAGIQRGCLGWQSATNGIETGVGASTQAVFTMSAEDTTLTWLWTNLYELTVSAAPGGIASTNLSGFYTNGVSLEIDATATGTYSFTHWSGDIPFDDRTSNPVVVTMDGIRTIQANFEDTVGRTRTWTGTGVWASVANWTPAGAPGSLDTAIIGSGTVTLPDPVQVASLVVSNGATLIFTNWTTIMTAVDVTILTNGRLSHAICDTNLFLSNSNRIAISCSNLTIAAGGSINANGLGYRAATNNLMWGQGPGGGFYHAAAGHGGLGGIGQYGGTAGATYGSVSAPVEPGSGAGCHNPATTAAPGGGAIRIAATGHVIVNGSISAIGGSGSGQGSAGSGGSVYISCQTFASTNGTIRANGGVGVATAYGGAGGGGGRIALVYDALAQSNLNAVAPLPVVILSASQGYSIRPGNPGTLYLSDAVFFPRSNTLEGGQIVIPGFTSWTVDGLSISNGRAVFPEGMQLTISNNLTLTGNGAGIELTNGALQVGGNLDINSGIYGFSYLRTGPASDYRIDGDINLHPGNLYYLDPPDIRSDFQIGGHLVLTNTSTLLVQSAMTNSSPDYGTLVNVGGDVVVATNCWIYPSSHPTNGGSPLFRMRNLSIAPGGGIDASGRGLNGAPLATVYGYGSGGGYKYDGAGYGGIGGKGGYSGGVPGGTYGSSNAPIDPGSGGGYHGARGGHGGGLVRIEAEHTVGVNGSILAKGGGPAGNQAGAGSGGGIYILCRTFSGSAGGLVQADGGDVAVSSQYNGGGGGGGRIAVVRKRHLYLGSVSATNGTAYAGHLGTPGTIVWREPVGGTVFVIH